eukprot:jgi/Mesen1/4117/ME000216S03367
MLTPQVLTCPVNELTWPEVVRRLLLTARGALEGAGRGRSPKERGALARCLGGDGGMLLEVQGGVAGALADARAFAAAEASLARQVERCGIKLGPGGPLAAPHARPKGKQGSSAAPSPSPLNPGAKKGSAAAVAAGGGGDPIPGGKAGKK